MIFKKKQILIKNTHINPKYLYNPPFILKIIKLKKYVYKKKYVYILKKPSTSFCL